MGFLTYSLRYYRDALQTLEDMPAMRDRIDLARQLLRMLDDLTDEGYTELNAALEKADCGAARLRTYLQKNHAAPFSFPAKPFDENALAYLPQNQELCGAIERAMQMARAMLESVDADKIIIVESGCAGTFPLLLMSLDDRADMRMYTTYPYLTSIYTGRVFTSHYEESRMFETMAAQDAYFRFSEMRNGMFYVQRCGDTSVERRALAEIGAMLTDENNQYKTGVRE